MNGISIDSPACFKCGNEFSQKREKTKHHAIPVFLKPVENSDVPVCKECHNEINQYTVQGFPSLNSLGNFIKNMKDIINKYEKVVSRFK